MTQKMTTTTVSHIFQFINKWAPQSTKLDYDNVGLLIGNSDQKVTKILTCLDVTEEVVDEAISKQCDLIISHHPLIFKGIKRIDPRSPEGATLYKLIQNNISVIAAHTNLDAANGGVSYVMAQALGLKKIQFLDDSYPTARRLSVTLPANSARPIRDRLEKTGIRDLELLEYPSTDGQPKMMKLEASLDTWQIREAKKIITDHLTEDGDHIRFQIFTLDNPTDQIGMGAMGEFEKAMSGREFLDLVSRTLSVEAIRYTGYSDKIKKVAVCGGAGVSLTSLARSRGADAFVTSDIKYHDYFIKKGPFMLLDVGHYESEVPIVDVMKKELKSRFENVDVLSTKIRTSPMRVHINDIQEKTIRNKKTIR